MPRRIAVSLLVLLPAATLLGGCEEPSRSAATVPVAPPGARHEVVPGSSANGRWSRVPTWPTLVASHLAVLPDGKVFTWNSSDEPGTTETREVYAWDPATGHWDQLRNGTSNVFCSGHTLLADGRLLVAGGHIADSKGIKAAHLYNATTQQWTSAGSMSEGRWYPSAVTLPNGEIVVLAGTNEVGAQNSVPEVFNSSNTSWRLLGGARLNLPYYPLTFLGPQGTVFMAGPDRGSRVLDPAGTGSWKALYYSTFGYRDWGTAVMYQPGKVLLIGGGSTPTKTTEKIDLNAGAPAWQSSGSMSAARKHANATILPDGRVLVTGGTSGAGFNVEAASVYAAEIWDPATDVWTPLASMAVGRTYHSTAALLPDGRVLSAGGGRCGSCQFNRTDAEMFAPPYLFTNDAPAVRPTISEAPSSVAHAQGFSVKTPDAAGVARVTLVRLSSVTHSFNMNQRFNELTFKQGAAGELVVTAPASANVAPPGHYMLFVLNGAGVPSKAKIIQLGSTVTPPPAPTLPPPAAPTSLAAVAGGTQQVNLTWSDNSADETGFSIERCRGAGCTDFDPIATVAANVTTFADAGLAPSTSYGYQVRATKKGANPSAYSNTASATTGSGATAPPPTAPAGPTSLAATAVNHQQVNLSWRDNSTNETAFDIEVCVGTSCSSGETSFSSLATVGANTTSFQDSKRQPATTYTYRVRARNGVLTSAYSNTAPATTKAKKGR